MGITTPLQKPKPFESENEKPVLKINNKKRIHMFISLLKIVVAMLTSFLPQQETLGEYWGTAEEESKYYKMVDVPLPKKLAVEAGSFEVMPDKKRLAIATRRGDIFLTEGVFDKHPEPKFTKFASGLDEVFGMAYRNGSFYVNQQTEVSRITDVDGDGRADRFETLSDAWGFRNYHEFAFGSKPDAQGNIWVALCLSKSYHSDEPFRGWCLKITPQGKTIPVCSGIRSPCGIGPNEHGVMFYAESQGPWNGSCSLKVLKPGGFMGHPASFKWYSLAPKLGKTPVLPNSKSRLEIERKRVKELVPYAVVFPYKRMGRSISGFMVDRTGGKFGPFENQIFIGDFSLGVVMRVTTEKINGVWQGACYPFREGFNTGLLALQFTPNGNLIAGGTNRGWPVRGPKAYSIQRLDWTGLMPFEIKEIKARPTGFKIVFTKPVDRKIASAPETYRFKTFTHIYQQGYGSPEVDQTTPKATKAVVAADGMSVFVHIDKLVQGHVHEFHLHNMRSADQQKLLHPSAYYTLNEIPKTKTRKKPANQTRLYDKFADGTTKNIIDFKRPKDAVQLVGPKGSTLIPEKEKIKCQWTFQDGVLTASPKWDSVITPGAYQDFRMHLEFNVNDAGDVPPEKNGNSGVYIQQRYELQILNSYGVSEQDYKNNYCSSIYRMKKPDKLVCKPAGQWQSFDIAFRAARFDGETKIQNARITVYQNGELIHDDYVMTRKTGAGKKEDATERPIKLQGHHNQVRFRNIWIQKLSLAGRQIQKPQPKPSIDKGSKTLPLPGEAFKFNGHEAFVILPKGAKSNIPWVWYAPTLQGLPGKAERWMFQKFLDAGVAIAGIDVGESYGSPNGRKIYSAFFDYLTNKRKFGKKPCLLARSRGGLMLYSWAAENPQFVGGIAGIYPVCNIASYPGIKRACGAYQLSAEQLRSDLAKYNPIDRLGPLAKAKIPIFHIHADKDKVVPLNENSGLLAQRYKKLGGEMTLEVVGGQGHNMWSGWFQSDNLVEFVLQSVGRSTDKHPVPKSDLWLTFPGKQGPGKGKHVVLITAEQEYRSEHALPMLAAILSQRHGFHCTVLFSVNEQGQVDPTLAAPLKDKTKFHRIPGLKYLAKADCVIWISRYMRLPDEQIKHFHDYFDSGKPLIALRTANHGFWGSKKYVVNGKPVNLRRLLGGAFMNHHGGWHRESTRGIIVDKNKTHPILIGVKDIWGPSDVYRCHNDKSPFPDDCKALVMGQPLMNLKPNSPANQNKEPLPIAWTKSWKGNRGLSSRIFHFTMGSGKDFENEGVRRLTVNAVYWGLKMEKAIRADSSVDVIGKYQPLKSGFNYKKLGVKPHRPQFYKPVNKKSKQHP